MIEQQMDVYGGPNMSPVTKEEAETAHRVYQETIALMDHLNMTWLALAERLYLIVHNEWYRRVFDYDTFEDFLSGEHLPSRAWVYNLIRVHGKYRVELDVPEDRLKEVGVTKLSRMASVVNGKNVDHWLEIASGATEQDLKREMGIAREIGEQEVGNVIEGGMYFLSRAPDGIIKDADFVGKRVARILKTDAGYVVEL